jgi:hypothetical protein
MYSVNLLPEKYLNNARNQAVKNRLIYGSILVLLTLFFFYRVLISMGNQRYDEYNSLAHDNLNLVSLIRQLRDPNSPEADANEINSIIDGLVETSKDYSTLLVLISNSAPDDVKVSYFSMKNEEGGVVCILHATASSYDTVSEWIVRLSEIDDLGEITSSYIAAAEESEENHVEFELRIPIL